jgi:DNA-binding LacI/PurR family transcriptional regulator
MAAGEEKGFMTRKPTASDVAKIAEVSRSAVSLVLGGRAKAARLSQETEARVRQVAADLHYKPNASGRSLKNGRTETIGLVIRDLSLLEVDPYLLPLLNGILQRARTDGYRVLVEGVRSDETGDPFGDLMDSGRIDGMIVENANFGDRSLRRLIKSGRPVVVLGSQGLREEWSVAINDQTVGRLATEHLIAIGRRRVAHISYSPPGIYAADQRRQGFLEAMKSAGVRVPPKYVVHADFSMETGYRAMLTLLALPTPPDAVFASSDAVATGAMAAVHDNGLLVPRDISIASVDDISASAYSRPSLTTVTSRPYDTGNAAADVLITLMSGHRPVRRRTVIDTQLVIRGSTDPTWSPTPSRRPPG